MIHLLLRTLRPHGHVRVQYDDPGALAALAAGIARQLLVAPARAQLVVVCIGTDRSTGDALGPIVGSEIRSRVPGLPVYGTLERPVHAVNLDENLRSLQQEVAFPYVLAIDACLGQASCVGQVTLASGPLSPGAGVHKSLPPVGDFHLTGIVNVGGFMEYFVLQNTRLGIVMAMARCIAAAVAAGVLESRGQMSPVGLDGGRDKWGSSGHHEGGPCQRSVGQGGFPP